MTHDQMLATLTLLGWECIGVDWWRNCGLNLCAGGRGGEWDGVTGWETEELTPLEKKLIAIQPGNAAIARAFAYLVEGINDA